MQAHDGSALSSKTDVDDEFEETIAALELKATLILEKKTKVESLYKTLIAEVEAEIAAALTSVKDVHAGDSYRVPVVEHTADICSRPVIESRPVSASAAIRPAAADILTGIELVSTVAPGNFVTMSSKELQNSFSGSLKPTELDKGTAQGQDSLQSRSGNAATSTSEETSSPGGRLAPFKFLRTNSRRITLERSRSFVPQNEDNTAATLLPERPAMLSPMQHSYVEHDHGITFNWDD